MTNAEPISQTRISLAEYLARTFHPDCEYVDGELVERNLGEREHSRPQGKVITYLSVREKQWGLIVLPEQRVQVTEERYRIPDVCAVLETDPHESIATRPPFLCVEILSKEDRMNRVTIRLDEFLKMGVPHIWVVDPMSRRGYRYTSSGLEEAKDGILRCPGSPVEVPLAELFD